MRAAGIALILLTLGGPLGAQASLAGTIVSRETGEPLGYAIVDIGDHGRARFANDSGAFFFPDIPVAFVTLRVRRLGYQPFDTSLVLDRNGANTIRIALQRVAVQLRGVTVRSRPACTKPGAPKKSDTALAGLFTQMRMNAEQYKLLTDKYPLHYILLIEQSRRLKTDFSVKVDSTEERRIDAAPDWRYEPGKLVTRQGAGWFVHLPMLIDFANKRFIDNHCFHYAGHVPVGADTLVQMDVVVSERIRSYDVSGSIFFDPFTYQIKRTVLELTSPWGRFGNVVDFEITTEFHEILPSISIISRLRAVQRMDPGVTSLDHDEAYETQELRAYQFLKARPGEPEKPKAKP